MTGSTPYCGNRQDVDRLLIDNETPQGYPPFDDPELRCPVNRLMTECWRVRTRYNMDTGGRPDAREVVRRLEEIRRAP